MSNIFFLVNDWFKVFCIILQRARNRTITQLKREILGFPIGDTALIFALEDLRMRL